MVVVMNHEFGCSSTVSMGIGQSWQPNLSIPPEATSAVGHYASEGC